MTQIFIRMSVNDASVKKHRNQQTVLSIFYSKCSYKMEYYLLQKFFLKIGIIFGGYLNFGCLHSIYFILSRIFVQFCAVNSTKIFSDSIGLDRIFITVTFPY
jgi:fatty-acid desaturase